MSVRRTIENAYTGMELNKENLKETNLEYLFIKENNGFDGKVSINIFEDDYDIDCDTLNVGKDYRKKGLGVPMLTYCLLDVYKIVKRAIKTPLIGNVTIQTSKEHVEAGKKVYERGFKNIGFDVQDIKDITEEAKFYLPLGKQNYKTLEIKFIEINNPEQIKALLNKENNPPKLEQPIEGETKKSGGGKKKKRRRTKRKTKKRKKKKKNKKKKSRRRKRKIKHNLT